MNSKKQYRTNQKELVLNYMQKHPALHMTAQDVYRALKEDGVAVGLTTVYRHLDKMVEDGLLIKSVVDENTPACFELSGHRHTVDVNCYHCKCVSCGRVIHLHCEEIAGLREHILNEHDFMVDPRRTVFFGLCGECRKEAQ